MLNVSSSISTCVWLAASLLRLNLDPFCSKYLDKTLAKLLSGGRAAMVIKLLHNVMFGSKSTRKNLSTMIQDDEKYLGAKEGLHNLLPKWFFVVRNDSWCKLMDSLLDPLQNAPLNKHLAYVLIDQIVLTLFPELSRWDFIFSFKSNIYFYIPNIFCTYCSIVNKLLWSRHFIFIFLKSFFWIFNNNYK